MELVPSKGTPIRNAAYHGGLLMTVKSQRIQNPTYPHTFPISASPTFCIWSQSARMLP